MMVKVPRWLAEAARRERARKAQASTEPGTVQVKTTPAESMPVFDRDESEDAE